MINTVVPGTLQGWRLSASFSNAVLAAPLQRPVALPEGAYSSCTAGRLA
jgi:hypothetical protein